MTKAEKFQVIEEYNKFLLDTIELDPVGHIQFDQMLKLGITGFFFQMAMNEMKAVLGDDESGDQPGT